ncbi:MAG TPA: hypothetical protein VMX96_00285 [Dehalococcoidia bacterium]|nr:hypothetical protein [Dehalococcoidia bacterium]
MGVFIKVGSRDKLLQKAKEGSGFETIEVLVTNDFELMVPEAERPYWVELYPSWDYRAIKANALQCGVLTAIVMTANPQAQQVLDSVWKQLIAIKKQFEGDAGVTKEILPGGAILSRARDGTVIIREALPHEIENN